MKKLFTEKVLTDKEYFYYSLFFLVMSIVCFSTMLLYKDIRLLFLGTTSLIALVLCKINLAKKQ